MLIAGIRQKINSELDSHRSASFMRYLMHYLQMFAYMGVIIPVIVGIDYYTAPKIKNEVVTNKYYEVKNNLNQIEYHFFTESERFLSDISFYENTNIDDQVTFYYTPIFESVTKVTSKSYVCEPHSIYGWWLIVIGLTFICSVVVIIQTWGWIKKREYVKYDSVVNWGVINAFLCIFTILSSLFHIP